MRMAESVTLTCWPPAPLDRNVSMRMSLSSISTSTSSGSSGQTYSEANDVWRRAAGIERRDAHEPVDAGLRREQAVRVLADHGERGALEAGLVARLIVDELAPEAAALRPAHVHAEQHLRPVLRFGSAGARVNRHDRVLAVVLAAEHLLDLAGLHFLVERVDGLRELGVDRFARRGPLDEDAEVVALLLERRHELAVLFEPAAALQDASGLRPGLSRNRARRRAPRGGSVRQRGERLQR